MTLCVRCMFCVLFLNTVIDRATLRFYINKKKKKKNSSVLQINPLTHFTNWGVGNVVSDKLAPFHHSQCPASVRLIVRGGQSGAYDSRAWQWFLCLSNAPRFLDACFPKRTLDSLAVLTSQNSQNRSKSVLL